jgi:hypothetical protein
VRSVTPGEAVALRALLATRPVSERERIDATGLGSRTFERIRKRAYKEGWVFDRFVPDPSRTGFQNVFFVVAQPFAEEIERVQARWKDLSSTVVLWRWPETVFGVFFSGESRARFLTGLEPPKGRLETFIVASSTRDATIPVYFDFEAAWSRLTKQRGALGYPHPLPAVGPEGEHVAGAAAPDPAVVAGLVRRPFRPGAEGEPLHVSPFFFPRSYQRLLESGEVERRTILDPKRVPPFQGRSIERVAFVEGELSAPGKEEDLFRMLMAVGVAPFLFASDGSHVLLATLSPAPNDPSPGAARPAVLSNLHQFLSGIQILREPIQALNVVVNHRYDRLFPSSS